MEGDLPEGWIRHEGGPCPVPMDSKPSVKFRDGMCLNTHLHEARDWVFPHAQQNLWEWGARRGPADIIAYKPEARHGTR